MNFVPYGQPFVDPDYIVVEGDSVIWVTTKQRVNWYGGISEDDVHRVKIGTITEGNSWYNSDYKKVVQLLPQFEFEKNGVARTVNLEVLNKVAKGAGNGGDLNPDVFMKDRLNQELEAQWGIVQGEKEYQQRRKDGTLPATISPTNNNTPIQELHSKLLPTEHARADIMAKNGADYTIAPPPSNLAVIGTPGGLGEQVVMSLGGFTAGAMPKTQLGKPGTLGSTALPAKGAQQQPVQQQQANPRGNSRPLQRPTNAPPGTVAINQHPDTIDIVHAIKNNLREEGVGPASYVGIAPNGDVIVTNPDGTATNLGHWGQYAN